MIQDIPVPKSLPVTAMMRLGKAISTTTTSPKSIELSEFDIHSMMWSCPQIIPFTIESNEFARGGFRAAFKATSYAPQSAGKTYAVKHYLADTLDAIRSVNETPENHTCSSVQMHVLAKYFADLVTLSVEKSNLKDIFHRTSYQALSFNGRKDSNTLLKIAFFLITYFPSATLNKQKVKAGGTVMYDQILSSFKNISAV